MTDEQNQPIFEKVPVSIVAGVSGHVIQHSAGN